MRYLKGTEITKENLKVGMKVIYLFERDIDKSGRGYFFPRTGTITQVNKKTIDFDDEQLFNSIGNLRECVEYTEENKTLNFNG